MERFVPPEGGNKQKVCAALAQCFSIAGRKKISVTVGTRRTHMGARAGERAHTCFLGIGCFRESEVMFLVPSRKRATLQVPFQLSLRDR